MSPWLCSPITRHGSSGGRSLPDPDLLFAVEGPFRQEPAFAGLFALSVAPGRLSLPMATPLSNRKRVDRERPHYTVTVSLRLLISTPFSICVYTAHS